MADEKKIGFKGDVSGFLSELAKANQKVKDYYNSSIESASKLSNSTKQQTDYLKLQAKATEDRIRALKQEQETLIKTFNIEKQRVQDQQRAGILSSTEAKGQIKSASGLLNEQLREGDLKIKDLDKVVELLKGVKDEIHLTAMKEIAEDRKSVQEQVSIFQKLAQSKPDQLFDKYSPDQVMKLQKQSELLGGGKAEQKKEQSIFGAILGAEMVKGLASTISKIGGSMAGADSGEQFLADALKGIPIAGELIGGMVGRHQEESYKAQVGTNRLRGRSGKGSMFGFSNLGFGINETMPIAEQAVTALGSADDIRGTTKDVVSAERAFSLDRGTLMEMLKGQRMTPDGDLSKNISVIFNTMKSQGYISDSDTTQFQEILQLQNSLVQQQSEVMEKVDPNSATGVIAAMRGVGGSFGDARAGSRISQISGALSSPGDDFQRARNMQVLSKLKPGASLFDIEEMQEKGIHQEGFLSETLKQLEMETGGGEGMLHAAKKRLGLSSEATRTLVEKFQQDRTRFDDMSNVESDMAEINMYGKASKLTPEREKEQARISDAFVSGGVEGLKQVGIEFGNNVAEMLKESGIPFGEEAGNAILGALNSDDKQLKEAGKKIGEGALDVLLGFNPMTAMTYWTAKSTIKHE